MANLQYIGARYVPIVFDNPDDHSAAWKSGVSYENLVIVTYLDDSYTSRKPVPSSVGDPASNPDYWAKTGDFNAGLSALENEVHALEDDFELYVEIEHNVLNFGAKNDSDTFDSATAINNAIVANAGSYIYIPAGKYNISAPIMTYLDNENYTDIIISKDAHFYALSDISYMVDLGGLGNIGTRELGIRKKYLVGGVFHAVSHVTSAVIHVDTNLYDPDISKLNIIKDNCDGIVVGDNNSTSNDAYIHHIEIRNKPQNYNVYGVVLNSNDNSLSDSRIYGNGIQVKIVGGSSWIDNVHTLAWADGVNTSTSFEIDGASAHISNCYGDGDDIMFDIKKSTTLDIANCIYYSPWTYPLTAFEISSLANPKICVSGFEMTCKNPSNQDVGVNFNAIGSDLLFKTTPDKIKFKNIQINGSTHMRDGDYLKGFVYPDSQVPFMPLEITDDKWYKIGTCQITNEWEAKIFKFLFNGRYLEFSIRDILRSGGYSCDVGAGKVSGIDYPNIDIGIDTNGVYTDNFATVTYYVKKTSAGIRPIFKLNVDSPFAHHISYTDVYDTDFTNRLMDNSFTPQHYLHIDNSDDSITFT